jgi:hypothetical protein
MSIIRDLGHFQVDISDVPLWAQLVLVLCFCVFVTGLCSNILMDYSIYKTAPSVPVPATGDIYPVRIKQGLRYVTREQQENQRFWKSNFKFAGIAFFVGLVICFAYGVREGTYVLFATSKLPSGRSEGCFSVWTGRTAVLFFVMVSNFTCS